jgi:hypothetical protein
LSAEDLIARSEPRSKAHDSGGRGIIMNAQIDSLYSAQSLLTLQGSGFAAFVVPAVIGYLVGHGFDGWRKWLSFVIVIGLAVLGV